MKIVDGAVEKFWPATLNAECPTCGNTVEWENGEEEDDTDCYASCCGQQFTMQLEAVRFKVEETQ